MLLARPKGDFLQDNVRPIFCHPKKTDHLKNNNFEIAKHLKKQHNWDCAH